MSLLGAFEAKPSSRTSFIYRHMKREDALEILLAKARANALEPHSPEIITCWLLRESTVKNTLVLDILDYNKNTAEINNSFVRVIHFDKEGTPSFALTHDLHKTLLFTEAPHFIPIHAKSHLSKTTYFSLLTTIMNAGVFLDDCVSASSEKPLSDSDFTNITPSFTIAFTQYQQGGKILAIDEKEKPSAISPPSPR